MDNTELMQGPEKAALVGNSHRHPYPEPALGTQNGDPDATPKPEGPPEGAERRRKNAGDGPEAAATSRLSGNR